MIKSYSFGQMDNPRFYQEDGELFSGTTEEFLANGKIQGYLCEETKTIILIRNEKVVAIGEKPIDETQ